jgi:hypothetical protein
VKKGYLLIPLSLSACRLPHLQTFALDTQVTVELPNQPRLIDAHKYRQLKHPERIKLWVLGTLGGAYQLIRAVNPALHIANRDTLGQEAYYRRKVKELIKRNALIIASRPFSVGGIRGRDIIYKSHATPQPKVIYSRSFVLDSVGYTLNFIPTFQEETSLLSSLEAKQRRRFFNSITVKP